MNNEQNRGHYSLPVACWSFPPCASRQWLCLPLFLPCPTLRTGRILCILVTSRVSLQIDLFGDLVLDLNSKGGKLGRADWHRRLWRKEGFRPPSADAYSLSLPALHCCCCCCTLSSHLKSSCFTLIIYDVGWGFRLHIICFQMWLTQRIHKTYGQHKSLTANTKTQ